MLTEYETEIQTAEKLIRLLADERRRAIESLLIGMTANRIDWWMQEKGLL